MRAIGEALGLGRTFPEAFLKALDGREAGAELPASSRARIRTSSTSSSRSGERSAARCRDRRRRRGEALRAPDARIARALGITEAEVRARRPRPGRLAVDSCAAEFEARTPYFYLSYEASDDPPSSGRAPDGRSWSLGSGPNRIGQGIEFDYCCVHAAQAFRQARLRGGARQLEPGDGLDRLRHLRPALPRAGDARARARRLRDRAAARRGRHARRADAAPPRRTSSQARRRAAARRPARRRSTPPRTAALRSRSSRSSACARRAGAWPTTGRRRWPWPSRSAIPCSSGRTTCSAAGGMRVAADSGGARDPRAVARRPVPRGRARARRRHALRRQRALGGRDPRARRAGRRPLGRLGLRRSGSVRDRRARGRRSGRSPLRSRGGLGVARPLQPPARGRRRRAPRPRGESACVANGSVRREGDRECRSSSTPAG